MIIINKKLDNNNIAKEDSGNYYNIDNNTDNLEIHLSLIKCH